jgi:hypothetical protein
VARKAAPKDGPREQAAKTDRAFVVSQIGDEKSDVRTRADEVLDFIIAPVATELSLDVVRSDRDPTPGHVTSRLIKLILESRVIIADLSGRNANVYYELGVAHSFRLPVVILVDNSDSLSFDTEHERVIEIGDRGSITARQADAAKAKLRETLAVVLKRDYKPSSLVTEVAEAQSLAKLAPDDPVASELATIKQRIDELAALMRNNAPVSTAGAFTYGGPVVSAPRLFGGTTLTPGISPFLFPQSPATISADDMRLLSDWYAKGHDEGTAKAATSRPRAAAATQKPEPLVVRNDKVAKEGQG